VIPAVPLDDWDVPRLVAHLNAEGLRLRLVPTQQDGVVAQRAFLTTTSKDWAELNCLSRIPECIDRWQGCLYCERSTTRTGSWDDQVQEWGDCCLVVGPFLFFGDRDLLERIRAALTGSLRSPFAFAGLPTLAPRQPFLHSAALSGIMPPWTGCRREGWA
jgi:hypothetical protein